MQPEKTASCPSPTALFSAPQLPKASPSLQLPPPRRLLPALPHSCFMQEHPHSHGKCSKVWERILNLL